MTSHFEDLWERCEKLFQENINKTDTSSIINELSMKVDLYKKLDQKDAIDIEIIKSRLLGEILLTLTSLSIKDNINVFS